MAKVPVTIFHNPGCGTSRNTLAMLRDAGAEVEVVEYLKAGWSAPQLRSLLKDMGLKARDILRVRGTDAEARGLTAPSVSDETIIAAMTQDPALVERPIVVTPMGAALCRPREKVLELLSPDMRDALSQSQKTVR